jgi:tyrosyl-tRNA synthetase
VELGATDQKFNVLLARDVQQAYGIEPQSILTMPILPGIDGAQKMSKSLDNYVGVDEPPAEVYGKLMRVPDTAMPIYYELLLDGPPDPALAPRDAKRAMARALTERFHGEEAARAAEERFDTLHVRRDLPDDVEEFAFAGDGGTVHVPALLADAFGVSRSEGRRLLAQAGVRLDGRAIGEDKLDMPAAELDGAVIQLGRRRFKRLRRR